MRVAVIGAGPAGYYATAALLESTDPTVSVDMYDRLPTPWGLVRAGVAPDHPKIKTVSTQFEKTALHPRYRFFGNVTVGEGGIDRAELLSHYDAVIYAVGAQRDRSLGIPGEDLPGSISAVDFVGWYNGHPDYRWLEPDLGGQRAAVIGNGNVALDVARMLVLPHAELMVTDTADHALATLEHSKVREVTILGRRGPAQAAFTTVELRELNEIAELAIRIDPAVMPTEAEVAELSDRAVRRNVEILRGWTEDTGTRDRLLEMRFLRSPVEIRGDGKVEEVVLAVNRLNTEPDGRIRAVDTGERETLATDLVIRAVGYRGLPIAGLPFDERTATVPNSAGAVTGAEREYVAGWIKRGPTGIIGTNRKCANETVRTLLDHARQGVLGEGGHAADDWRPGDGVVDYHGWQLIDEIERARGTAQGRPRAKIVDLQDMLDAINGNTRP